MQSERLPLLRARKFIRLSQPPFLSQVCKAQPYLATANAAHREALIRLITSDHPSRSKYFVGLLHLSLGIDGFAVFVERGLLLRTRCMFSLGALTHGYRKSETFS